MREGDARERGEGDERRGQWFLLVLSVLLLAGAAFLVRPWLAPVVMALLVGYLARPLYASAKKGLRRDWAAASATLFVVLVALVAPFLFLAYAVMRQARELAPLVRENGGLAPLVVDQLARLGVSRGRAQAIVESASGWAASALESFAGTALTTGVHAFFGVVLFFILLYFVLVDGDALVGYVRRVMPLDGTRRDRLLARTGERVKAIFLGTVLIAGVQGVVAGVGWWILGLPAPLFWGFVMVVLEVVPLLGAFAILIPAALWSFSQGNVVDGVGLLVLNFVMVGLVDDVVRPVVISRLIGRENASGAHPAILLVGIAGGILVFGWIGFVLGPLILSLLGPVLEAWVHPEREPLAAPDER